MSADLLRRAAEKLRDPYRCNTDWIVDQALAEWLDDAAKGVDARLFAEAHVGLADGSIKTSGEDAAVAVARAILREEPT